MPDPTENGHTEGDAKVVSLAERAAMMAGETPNTEDDQGELFEHGFLDGDDWTLAQVHKSKKPVEVTASMSKAEVPLKGGLPNPSKVRRCIVRTGHTKFDVVPEYEEQGDGNESIIAWKVRANMRVAYVEPIVSSEKLIRDEFERLCTADPQAAAKLADALVVHASGGEPVAD